MQGLSCIKVVVVYWNKIIRKTIYTKKSIKVKDSLVDPNFFLCLSFNFYKDQVLYVPKTIT